MAGSLAAMPGSSTCGDPRGKGRLWGRGLGLEALRGGQLLSRLPVLAPDFTFLDAAAPFFLSVHATLQLKHHWCSQIRNTPHWLDVRGECSQLVSHSGGRDH